ncbi:fumarylacetoacetate hydrolase family protein [Pseudonocardia broussonetiae]|uniref:Fumarylacetoacetate hydrolase family protein n=1 Tax=Pseudonocardia broussonetiae TaxID=2736640 RepID=A0A6M6JL93_9PSEU|nr:fumarylacetoacetate hydrolase family protein [Pseudonocardia broussonetiae]QJY48904.1 fumarylacetoacetate hydrolase family protein [Pseudonocardia broussonetiae]
MKWVSYVSPASATPRAGVLVDDEVRGLDDPATLTDLIGAGTLDDAGRRAHDRPAEVVPLAAARLLAPVPRPPSIRDFGCFELHFLNASRALGLPVDPVWYEQPVFYFSNPAAVRGPGDDIPVSPGSDRFDYEVEVAAVIGREGGDLRPDEAERHIAGYTVLCDWSARDLQAREAPMGFGPVKGKDGATSLGPVLVTPDELEPHRAGHGFDLAMTASVNGVPVGGGTWADIHWSFGQMLSYASRGTRLVPGDVIGSGTVGNGCLLEQSGTADSAPWLRPGDVVDTTVEGIGTLTGRVVGGVAVVPLCHG